MSSSKSLTSVSLPSALVRPDFSCSRYRSGAELYNLLHKVAHEVGNPLTSIIALATVLQRPEARETKGSAYTQSIIEEAWRISGVFQKLLLIVSEQTAHPTRCDISESLAKCLAKLRRQRKDLSNVDIDFDPGTERGIALIDREQLITLFNEVISNACEAVLFDSETFEKQHPEYRGPRVRIEIKPFGNFTRVIVSSVTSRPCATELVKLFEPFVTDTPDRKRIGLGLTVAWAIVERFQGGLEICQSETNNGSVFSVVISLPQNEEGASSGVFTIPDFAKGANTPDVGKTSHQSGSWSNINEQLPNSLTVLVIEDEKTVSSAIKKILDLSFAAKTAFTCRCVNPTEGLNLLKSGATFDVLLCDLSLENNSGKKIFDYISKKRQADLAKLAFITGSRDSMEAQVYLATSGRPYLLKPFEPQELVELVIKMTRGKSSN